MYNVTVETLQPSIVHQTVILFCLIIVNFKMVLAVFYFILFYFIYFLRRKNDGLSYDLCIIFGAGEFFFPIENTNF